MAQLNKKHEVNIKWGQNFSKSENFLNKASKKVKCRLCKDLFSKQHKGDAWASQLKPPLDHDV